MFAKLRRARTDLATMHALLPAAERRAQADGADQPGAEHLLLAALDLNDGIARAALAGFDIDADRIGAAITDQHAHALRSIGVLADEQAIDAALPEAATPTGPYRSAGSLQTAFQRAVQIAKDQRVSLNSGHVLLAVTDADHGTVVRALEHLGVDRDVLRHEIQRLLD